MIQFKILRFSIVNANRKAPQRGAFGFSFGKLFDFAQPASKSNDALISRIVISDHFQGREMHAPGDRQPPQVVASSDVIKTRTIRADIRNPTGFKQSIESFSNFSRHFRVQVHLITPRAQFFAFQERADLLFQSIHC